MNLQPGGRRKSMSSVMCQISISLDGFVARPNQSLENPIGEGGRRLHQWVFETASWREQHGGAGGAGPPAARGVRCRLKEVDVVNAGRMMLPVCGPRLELRFERL